MMVWRVIVCVAAFLGVVMLITCAGRPFDLIAEAVVYIGFGWIGFLRSVLPQVTFNWAGVATAIGCLIAIAIGSHLFLRWLWANAGRRDHAAHTAWRPRWTAALVGSVVMMFASGICVVGTAHQTAWLLTSKERLVGYSQSVREGARRNQSNNNLKQIGLGLQTYADVAGSLPAGATFDERGRPLHSWQTRLLPYVEQVPLYNRINRSLPWDAAENRWPFSQQPPVYLHPKTILEPDERGYARSGYAGNAYVLGGPKPWRLAEIRDGETRTILCGEAVAAARPWGDPINWRDPARGIGERPDSFGGAFTDVTQFVFADGHTTALSNKMDPAVFRALCTPAAGEAIANNDYDY